MDTKKQITEKNHTDEMFKDLSKKRTRNMLADDVFHSMSSKADLYKHLDLHLQVRTTLSTPNILVLYMPLRDVHQGLREGDLCGEEASHQEKECPLH